MSGSEFKANKNGAWEEQKHITLFIWLIKTIAVRMTLGIKEVFRANLRTTNRTDYDGSRLTAMQA